jgi:hypothetical protein
MVCDAMTSRGRRPGPDDAAIESMRLSPDAANDFTRLRDVATGAPS